jgi:hypothetical protein
MEVSNVTKELFPVQNNDAQTTGQRESKSKYAGQRDKFRIQRLK